MTLHPALRTALAVAALCAPALAPAADRPLSSFEQMDANRDGRITHREHHTAARRMFEAMDTNRDGRVTAAEMQAAHSLISDKPKAGQAPPSSADKIKAVDTDGDGVLSGDEHAAGAKAMFSVMDANADLVLTKREFNAGHARLLASAGKP